MLLTLVLRPFVKCGQQALAVFLSGMVLSHIGGMIFDHAGNGAGMQLLVNGVSFAALFAIAYTVAWFKATPWKRRAAPTAPVAAPDIAGPERTPHKPGRIPPRAS